MNTINELIKNISNQIIFRLFKFFLSGKNIPETIIAVHNMYIIGIITKALAPGKGNMLSIISISINNKKINKMGIEGFMEVLFISVF